MSEDLKDEDPNNNISKDEDPNNTALESEVVFDESVEKDEVPCDNVPKDDDSYIKFQQMLEAAMGQRPASHGIDDLSDLNGGSEPPSHERHRSQSLNLPHSNDQAVINVGRMLRRLSGEFEQRRTGQFIEMQQRSSFSSYFNKLS